MACEGAGDYLGINAVYALPELVVMRWCAALQVTSKVNSFHALPVVVVACMPMALVLLPCVLPLRLKPTPTTAVLRRVMLRSNLAVAHSVSMPQRLEAP
jgi:hypothetical protein